MCREELTTGGRDDEQRDCGGRCTSPRSVSTSSASRRGVSTLASSASLPISVKMGTNSFLVLSAPIARAKVRSREMHVSCSARGP
jgi:hypothetical protein